ncbi:MAG: hemerythrin domain-containing protein [bacterium]
MISIIAPPSNESPMALLLACHDRIRQNLKVCWKLAEADEQDVDAIRNSARNAATYLTQALPLHMEDERDSVMPRLLGQSDRLDRALICMEREHQSEVSRVQDLLRLLLRLAQDPKSLSVIRSELSFTVRHLTVSLESHLTREEKEIFPLLAALDQEEQDTIVFEMRRRRNPDYAVTDL